MCVCSEELNIPYITHARTTIRVLLERLSAVDVFTSLKTDPNAVSFEDGLMALSQFEGISIKDVSTSSCFEF